MSNKVQAVFGKFAVEIDGKVELFDNEAAAQSAAVLSENKAAFEARANAFVEALGLNVEGKEKTAAAKRNVVVDFLAFEAGSADASEEAETF